MASIHHLVEPLAESERNERIYRGEILVFRGFDAVAALVECLRARCREHLGDDPEGIHTRLPEDEVNRAAESLRYAVLRDSEAAGYLNAALEAIGADLDATYGDGLKLRVQMAQSESGKRMVSPLGAHRDTWGSNIMAQTNWWAPVYPTTPERTIALFPTWFTRPVANNSAGWDFDELRRRIKDQGPNPDYPLLPLATVPPDHADALPISLVPGDLMCFSGAHLHASVPNLTDRTRLSFEIRTVNDEEVAVGRGAQNLDGAALRTTYQLFRHLTDHEKLGEMA